ncbi:MAG: hypothetical protein IJ521_01880 [Schwartzia sp.]|nr:hypothetical protein [Schwartzia sp. (in: firmicutes)]
MDGNCNEAEGARLLETMRTICNATGCVEVEHATLAYEEALQEKSLGNIHVIKEEMQTV